MSGAILPTSYPKKGDSVHLMLTCLCDAFYPEVGQATVKCLEALGYDVEFRADQTCCGQPAFNAGDQKAALSVARHSLKVFRDAETVVAPSGSCAAMVRWGFPQLFRGEPDYDEAVALAGKTWEISEFIFKAAGVEKWEGAYPHKVALHRSCHLRELQFGGSGERLLQSLDGIEILELSTPEQCCGFGGTFSVSFPWTSRKMAEDKINDLTSHDAEVIVSTDMGCLMHLRGLSCKNEAQKIEAPKFEIPTRHLVEVLADSLRQEATV
jgi:L-lactate dehydrogenase complex protein LldE